MSEDLLSFFKYRLAFFIDVGLDKSYPKHPAQIILKKYFRQFILGIIKAHQNLHTLL